jgi:hypothetical protein
VDSLTNNLYAEPEGNGSAQGPILNVPRAGHEDWESPLNLFRQPFVHEVSG